MGEGIPLALLASGEEDELPMLAAWPVQIVATGGFTYCIVSYIASPLVIKPPGELTYQ